MSSNRWSLRAFTRSISVLSITSVLAAGLAAIPVIAQAKPEVAPSSAKTVADASRLAAKFNTSVEVEEKTTPYSRTVATPAGTLKAEVSNEPVRVQKNGAWTAIDTTLAARGDGMIAPKASTTDIAFSAGGNGPLARFTRDGGFFELKAPWLLPAPTLSGSKATYAAVLPGVDLVVEATDSSFSYNLVVQNREAASNPALRSLTFPVTTKDLHLRTTLPGRPSYVDSNGRQVITVGEPVMWDAGGTSTKTKVAATEAVERGPSGRSKRALMALSGTARGLTVTPDQKLLTAADTVFPVVIDPTTSLEVTRDRNAWTAVWELYPTTSFWKTTHSLGVGYEGFEQNKIVRSFFQFDVAAFTNKHIIKASLKTYEIHSASCAARSVTVSRTGAISTATTWNSQPAVQATVASANVAKGYNSTCPAGGVEFPVTSSVQATSKANGKIATFRLSATNESDEIAWKQFNSTGQLIVEYVAYPLPAYGLGVATDTDLPSPCAPSTNPTIVASLLPQVSAKGLVGAGEPSASIYVQFQLVTPSQVVQEFQNAAPVTPNVLVKLKPRTALTTGIMYTYRARTIRAVPGQTLVSAWSPSCYFKVDTTPPPAPVITAKYNGVTLTDCLTSTTPDVCPEVVPFGAKVTYTISSGSADVAALSYGFNGKMTRVSGRSVTVNLLTPGQTLMTLGAVSHDAADHTSTTKYHRINVGPGLPPSGAWNLDEGSGTTAADSSGKGHPLAVTGAQFDDAGRVGGSLTFDGNNSGNNRATVAGAASVVDTSQNFTISAWVRPTAAKDGGVVAVTGTQAYGGLLRYSAPNNRWAFVQNVSDASTAGQARVDSLAAPVLNVWTHLLGVFNVTDKTISLYVNGRLQGTAAFTHTPWKANGTIEVGSYQTASSIGVLSGAVDDVKIYPRVMSATEANKVADPRIGPSGNDEPIASPAAKYPFDSMVAQSNGLWTTEDTVYGQNLTVSGFAGSPDQSSAIVEDPERGNVLATTGTASELLAVNRALVDSSASFTVTLWVRIQDPTKRQVFIRQVGANRDSWRIEYRPGADDSADWVFSRATSDTTTGAYTEVTQSTNQTTAGEWTALAAQYNAATDQVTLLVADRSGDGGVASFSTPFQGTANVLSWGPQGDTTFAPLNAALDDLRVYTGVVPQRQLCIEFGGDPTECS
ncbi:LamG-like jellyroll fold domain-containing protein [Kribbella sp. NPDC005582]|uniref:LamG-like jellyroll fold domain-containing protein n=1 Tax=Kribbella sp. NPDC005582 TaxID=3156893 RepID=UPI0033B3FF97